MFGADLELIGRDQRDFAGGEEGLQDDAGRNHRDQDT